MVSLQYTYYTNGIICRCRGLSLLLSLLLFSLLRIVIDGTQNRPLLFDPNTVPYIFQKTTMLQCCCAIHFPTSPPPPPHHNMQLTYHRHPLMDLMSLRWKRVDNMVDIVLDLM